MIAGGWVTFDKPGKQAGLGCHRQGAHSSAARLDRPERCCTENCFPGGGGLETVSLRGHITSSNLGKLHAWEAFKSWGSSTYSKQHSSRLEQFGGPEWSVPSQGPRRTERRTVIACQEAVRNNNKALRTGGEEERSTEVP
ncbi:hypothetical protein UPYG_G00110540 [Umbra pygmaea]|uniref:Uncharacterized protein n=1 Tax=Umbra pygmaea TaxID=75934 RepID=A0ABD0X2T0_UMBPY